MPKSNCLLWVRPVFNLLKYVASAQLPRQKGTILFVVAHNVADSSVSITRDWEWWPVEYTYSYALQIM
jgi:hypothetical protein